MRYLWSPLLVHCYRNEPRLRILLSSLRKVFILVAQNIDLYKDKVISEIMHADPPLESVLHQEAYILKCWLYTQHKRKIRIPQFGFFTLYVLWTEGYRQSLIWNMRCLSNYTIENYSSLTSYEIYVCLLATYVINGKSNYLEYL